MALMQTRRHFLTTIGLAGAAGVIQVGAGVGYGGAALKPLQSDSPRTPASALRLNTLPMNC